MAWIKAYKGFDMDMKCRWFQFEEGQEYEEQEASLCKNGFHACEAPMDCFNYYPPDKSQYRVVELGEVSDERSDDTKRVGKKIKIGAKLKIAQVIEAQVEYVKEHSTGDSATTGEGANAVTTGNWANAATTGEGANAVTTGNCANAVTTSNWANAEVKGQYSIAATIGKNSKAKATVGNWIVCAEYDAKSHPVCVKAAQVDGEKIKPDTWYTLKDGEFVEANE